MCLAWGKTYTIFKDTRLNLHYNKHCLITKQTAVEYGCGHLIKAYDRLRFKRVFDPITAYESIVEENYIDNLVRARRKRDRIFDNDNVIK